MTDKEFRRLKRSQLIDIIYHLKKEIEEQKKTIEDLQKQRLNEKVNSTF